MQREVLRAYNIVDTVRARARNRFISITVWAQSGWVLHNIHSPAACKCNSITSKRIRGKGIGVLAGIQVRATPDCLLAPPENSVLHLVVCPCFMPDPYVDITRSTLQPRLAHFECNTTEVTHIIIVFAYTRPLLCGSSMNSNTNIHSHAPKQWQ